MICPRHVQWLSFALKFALKPRSGPHHQVFPGIHKTWSRHMASKNDKRIKKLKNKDSMAPQPGKAAKVLDPPPEFIAERLALWDRLKAEQDATLAAKVPEDITVTLPDGKEIPGQSWRTTPYEVAKGISQGLADNSVVAKVNGEVWDLDRPLENSCSLALIKFDDDEGQAVFWHSSAHILGEAMERVYGAHLCYGPPIEGGFYYDMWSDEQKVTDGDFKVMEDLIKKIVKEKQPFERLTMKKSDLLEMFKYNEFKVRILNQKVKTETTTVYRCGPLIDLCRGPHVRHTGKIKAMTLTKNSAAYWEGNANAESLQRVYGISFPDTKQLKEWKVFQEEAAKRDHRKLGREQELFFFSRIKSRILFFSTKGRSYLQQTNRFHAKRVLQTRLPRGRLAQHLQLKVVANFWSLGTLCRQYVQV